MSKKKTDRRIEKTHNNLAFALFNMMQKQSWNSISIQQLCDEANVARTSFYTHFDSKLELLDFLIAEVFDKQIPSKPPPPNAETYEVILTWLIDHVTSNRALFSRISKEPEALPVLDRFKMALEKRFVALLKSDGHVLDETGITFLMGGTFDALLRWSKRWRIAELAQLRVRILEMTKSIIEAM
jgi:AcrR family transcriptional regulator